MPNASVVAAALPCAAIVIRTSICVEPLPGSSVVSPTRSPPPARVWWDACGQEFLIERTMARSDPTTNVPQPEPSLEVLTHGDAQLGQLRYEGGGEGIVVVEGQLSGERQVSVMANRAGAADVAPW